MLVLASSKSCVWVMEGRGGDRGGRLEVFHVMTSFGAPFPTSLPSVHSAHPVTCQVLGDT